MEKLRDMLKSGAKPKVAVDVDSTLAEVHEIMIELYNARKGKSYTVKDHTDWDFKAIESSYEEMMVLYSEAWRDHHRRIKFLGNIHSLAKLSDSYSLEILTTRSPDNDGVTGGTVPGLKVWLAMHKLDSLPLIVCPPHRSKADMDYQIYIDDSPTLAAEIEKRPGKVMLLIDRPYNRRLKDSESVIRVRDIEAACELLASLATQVSPVRAKATA